MTGEAIIVCWTEEMNMTQLTFLKDITGSWISLCVCLHRILYIYVKYILKKEWRQLEYRDKLGDYARNLGRCDALLSTMLEKKIEWLYSRKALKIEFPGGSDGKESACNAADPGSMLGSKRSLGEGHGNLLQYSCLEGSMDRGAWRATVHGFTKSQTGLSNWHLHFQDRHVGLRDRDCSIKQISKRIYCIP